MQKELTALQQEVKTVQQEIGNLPKQAEADKQAILIARKQDEEMLRQKLKIGKLDDEGLTQTLLGKTVNDQLASVLGWIGWAREQVPTSAKQTKKLRSRGTTVLFTPPKPKFLIEQLQLEAQAQLNGEPLMIVGTITDASDAPHLVAEPMRIEMHGREALPFILDCVIDRRGEFPVDQLVLKCPQLPIPGGSLGNANKFAFEMGEGIGNVEVHLQLTGQQLDGEISYTQDSLQLTPKLAKSPSRSLTKALEQSLSGVERLEANVTIAGTLKKTESQHRVRHRPAGGCKFEFLDETIA